MDELIGNSTVKVLFVDDDTHLISSYKRQYEKKYDVALAETGAEALELIKQHDDFAVIIADFKMPQMDGIVFLQQSKKLSPNTVSIMLTGYADMELAIKALHEGEIYRFLTKPCSNVVLGKTISDAIEKYNIDALKSQLANTALELDEANKTLSDKMRQLEQLHNKLRVSHDEKEDEMQIAKEVFDRLIFSHNNDKNYLDFWISPMSIFSGDLMVSAQSQDGHAYIMLADFTGHGLPAAIGAPLAANVFVSKAVEGVTLSEIVSDLNHSLFTVLPTHLFSAVGILEYDINTSKLSVWNAGLPDIYVYDQDGSIISKIKSAHLPMGIHEYENKELECVVLDVEKNNKVFMYSDGLIEAQNSSGEMYGSSTLEKYINPDDAPNLFDKVKTDVENFIGNAEQQDDITMVGVRFGDIEDEFSTMVNSGLRVLK